MNKKVLKESFKLDTQSVVLMGILIALEIVLTRFMSFSTWNMRIGFGFVPLAIAGMMLGPAKAGIIGVVADIIGATLFPTGAFFPGFTLTAFLKGVVYGTLLYKKQNSLRILAAVSINQLVLSLMLNTLWISILSGSPCLPLMITRIMQCSILIPVELVTITLISKSILSKIKSQKIAM